MPKRFALRAMSVTLILSGSSELEKNSKSSPSSGLASVLAAVLEKVGGKPLADLNEVSGTERGDTATDDLADSIRPSARS